MRKPFLITTDFPDAEEVGIRLGMPRERVRELIRRADEAYRQDIAKNGKPKAASKGSKNAAAKKRGGHTSADKK